MRKSAALHSAISVLRSILGQQNRRFHESDFQHYSVCETNCWTVSLVHSALPGILFLYVELLSASFMFYDWTFGERVEHFLNKGMNKVFTISGDLFNCLYRVCYIRVELPVWLIRWRFVGIQLRSTFWFRTWQASLTSSLARRHMTKRSVYRCTLKLSCLK